MHRLSYEEERDKWGHNKNFKPHCEIQIGLIQTLNLDFDKILTELEAFQLLLIIQKFLEELRQVITQLIEHMSCKLFDTRRT